MTTKQRTSLLVVAFLSVVLSFPAWAQPNFEVGSVSGARGATVNVPVTFTNNGSVVGLQFDVQSDPGVLDIGTLTNGTALPPHSKYSAIPFAGTLRVVITPANPPVSPLASVNDGVLINVPVTIKLSSSQTQAQRTL